MAAAAILLSLVSLNYGLRSRSRREKLYGKDPPVQGKGGKIHAVYLGIVLLLIGVYLLFIYEPAGVP